jgi:hypothetical protein
VAEHPGGWLKKGPRPFYMTEEKKCGAGKPDNRGEQRHKPHVSSCNIECRVAV